MSVFHDKCLVGCDFVYTGRVYQLFKRNYSSLRTDAADFSETFVPIYQTKWCHLPENSDLQIRMWYGYTPITRQLRQNEGTAYDQALLLASLQSAYAWIQILRIPDLCNRVTTVVRFTLQYLYPDTHHIEFYRCNLIPQNVLGWQKSLFRARVEAQNSDERHFVEMLSFTSLTCYEPQRQCVQGNGPRSAVPQLSRFTVPLVSQKFFQDAPRPKEIPHSSVH
jgi:hypothetical protein